MNFKRISKTKVSCQFSVKPTTNVSCRLNFRQFVSCQFLFWPFVSCQLTPSRPSTSVPVLRNSDMKTFFTTKSAKMVLRSYFYRVQIKDMMMMRRRRLTPSKEISTKMNYSGTPGLMKGKHSIDRF